MNYAHKSRGAMEMRCGYCWKWTCNVGDDRALIAHQSICPFVPKDTQAVIKLAADAECPPGAMLLPLKPKRRKAKP